MLDFLGENIQSVLPILPQQTWETLYSTVISTFFAYVIGIPVGVLLATGTSGGILKLPKVVSRCLDIIVNLLRGVIEAAQAMGCSPFQIITKVMLPESVPSIISGAAIALTTIMGYGAMAGIIGAGGLGNVGITYGYYRYKYSIMYLIIIMLVILVQIFQTIGTWLSVRSDKRISYNKKRSKRK